MSFGVAMKSAKVFFLVFLGVMSVALMQNTAAAESRVDNMLSKLSNKELTRVSRRVAIFCSCF